MLKQEEWVDAKRVVLSTGRSSGRGTGLGKVEQKPWTIKKLRQKFREPMVDQNTTFPRYLKLKAIAADLKNPRHKEANDAILDMKRSAGNWTAARYSGKKRKVTDIVAKTMLVLDIDHANPDQTADIRAGLTPCSEFYWLAHTSRSHYPEKPKFRLAFPVSREMTPEEAHACLRLLSTYLLDDPQEGIEIVDSVTFRPNQTMFWPSISKGQDYWWDENRGAILDVDEFLARHPGWDNYESLPYREDEKQRGLKDPSVKMEDPREKAEPIGAFCRTYSVEDAIDTFLPEVYERSLNAADVRYNYVPGSANNGAIVYDDGLFLLSLHASDPAEGMHNAFDLVRIHKFGHLDDAAHGNTSPGNMPSFKAMVEFCRGDEDVTAEEFSALGDALDDLGDETDDEEEEEDQDDPISSQTDDAPAPGPSKDIDPDDPLGSQLDDLDDEEEDEDAAKERAEKDAKKEKKRWLAKLLRKANGDIEPRLSNITLICQNDPRIAPCIAYNEFTLSPICRKPIRSKKIETPSEPVPKKDRATGRKWSDSDDTSIKLIASYNSTCGGYEVEFTKDNIQDAVLSAGKLNRFHPVKDFIEGCHRTWIERGRPEGAVARLAADLLGCPDTPFHRESARMYLLGAVARIYEPGCKFDAMLILEGPTGSRKSTFFEVLFNGLSSDLDCDLDDTGRLIENIRGWWCKEMAEMKVAKRADANTLKRTLSAASDTHRLAYGRREDTYPRQNVFAGTSNEDDYLTDPTSSRRYWVWRTPKTEADPIDTDRLHGMLWQLWGETYQAYLDMRVAKPEGALHLDLRDPEVQKERDRIAGGSRKLTATEMIAEEIGSWLDKPRPAEEVMVDASGLTLDGYEGDTTPMVRNMVTAKDAFDALSQEPTLRAYRNADVRTYGKALALVPGWRDIGRVRRHDQRAAWFVRGEDGPLWVPAPEEEEPEDEGDNLEDLLA
ncbi:VapE domain-containing protein [Jannaschia seohaensis]|uniref:Virulence-associated protein E n=1 Tax=Jannaschia seohaensis TaxID=475081 RepID=A0A2Y9AHM4_9RHOB|nr:VapE domain-containing protein [Jannaschia seohaensis]PWJ21423.1 virulence-associated protein E [Jannaschia seohaensis]SSA42029.1 Virulence-associated protein E [Jannaschia seohaensis]